eukprot:TRINITY_DN1641_c0_g1_i2.p1 TRINITY_DN1641_c0_g1~~TRINITY_DN1641_c0_g1_i2.p1  ORF type:complete len:783 (-),score=113.67 TRINITY_DN1641_c0_g1_i2:68-2416(-)
MSPQSYYRLEATCTGTKTVWAQNKSVFLRKNFSNCSPKLCMKPSKAVREILQQVNDQAAALEEFRSHPTTAENPLRKLPPLVPYFTGRTDALDMIQRTLGQLTPGTRNGVVVCGLAGEGKTQLAAKFVHDNAHRYDVVWTMFAQSKEQLFDDYVQLGIACGTLANDAQDTEDNALKVRRWLTLHGNWLLLFDNVDDSQWIRAYIPDRTGHVLITSRDSRASSWSFTRLPLQRLAEADCSKLFLQLSPTTVADELLNRLLVADLQCHALCVTVAACYVNDTGCTIQAFCKQLPVTTNREGEYPEVLLTVVQLLLERLSLCARTVMEDSSFVSSVDIPFELFARYCPMESVSQIFFELRKFTLALGANSALTVHPLIQQSIRELCDYENCLQRVCSSLLAIFRTKSLDPIAKLRKRAQLCIHIFAASKHTRTPASASLEMLQKTLPWIIGKAVNPVAATAMAQKLYSVNKRAKGMLAVLLTATGCHVEGLALQREMLQWTQDRFGAEHIFTLGEMAALGNVLHQTGRHLEAYQVRQQALTLSKKCPGLDDADLAIHLGALATSSKTLGMLSDAVRYNELALTLRRKGNHAEAELAVGLINLADTYSDVGRYSEALVLAKRGLALRRDAYGDEDTVVAEALTVLGHVYHRLGQFTDALAVDQEALKVKRIVFGEQHPGVVMAMNNLSVTYMECGRHDEAIVYQQQVLDLRQKVLESTHPDIAQSMKNLGAMCLRQGRYREGLIWHMQAAQRHREQLDESHATVQQSRQGIAEARCFLRLASRNNI